MFKTYELDPSTRKNLCLVFALSVSRTSLYPRFYVDIESSVNNEFDTYGSNPGKDEQFKFA